MTDPKILDMAREMIALSKRIDDAQFGMTLSILSAEFEALTGEHAAAVAEALLAAVAENERLRGEVEQLREEVDAQRQLVLNRDVTIEEMDACHCGRCDWCLINKGPMR